MKEQLKEILNNILERFATPKLIAFSVIDILVTVFLVYALLVLLKKNNATRLIKYLVLITVVAFTATSNFVDMPILERISSNVVLLLVIAVAILFAPNLRRALWKISSPKAAETTYATKYDCSDDELRASIADIVRATQNMSKKDIGALIVIAPDTVPEHILDSGTRLNSQLSCQLIECLFNPKAPLHDGAVFIRGNKILAAGCFLPLTQQADLDKDLGTRHRAAIGITEQSDHLAIIVSEETGIISVARNGEILRYFDSQMLTDVLEQIYGLKAVGKPTKHSRRRS